MPRLRLTLAYDGTGFAGSQVQPGRRTVQGELERALAVLDGASGTVRAAFAGRTDAGVHAEGQEAHADVRRDGWDGERWRYGLNALLSPDVRVLAVREVAGDWHARYDARWREYHYRVWNGPVLPPLLRGTHWHTRAALDVGVMETAARGWLGEHDFAAFAGDGKGVPGSEAEGTTTRTVRRADWPDWLDRAHRGNWAVARRSRPVAGVSLTFRVEANGFLAHMVRNMMGALAAVGRGELAPDGFTALLAGRDRRLAPPPAPPQGLTLWRVRYDDDSDTDHEGDDAEWLR